MPSQIPFYSSADVFRLLDPLSCGAAVRQAMMALSAAAGEQPMRSIMPIRDGGLFALMPGYFKEADIFGVKAISVFDDAEHRGRAAHRGAVLLFDDVDGHLIAVVDGAAITELRTAAASAVATEALACHDAADLAIFGYGSQAESHVRALAAARPLRSLTIWGRSLDKARVFAERMGGELGLPSVAVEDPQAAAGAADIICTVTGSLKPVLRGVWVRPGTHINLVGSSYLGPVEIDTDLVAKSRYVADSRASVLAAGAEFANAKAEGAVGDDHIVAEIGEVLLGRVAGRRSDHEITVYKSLGHVFQDLAAAACVHARATGCFTFYEQGRVAVGD